VSVVAAVLAVLAAAAIALRRHLLARAIPSPTSTTTSTPTVVETWGCGFAAPTARMQYTGSSFAELLLARFSWAVRPRASAVSLPGPFPPGAAYHSAVPDPVLDLALVPAARACGKLASRARVLYLRSLIHFQMLLVLVTLVAVLAWGFVW
jgi:hypothetical protein